MSETFSDIACTLCGCVCDDLQLTIENQQIVAVSPGCAIAEPWLLNRTMDDLPATLFNGEQVDHATAISKAVEILKVSQSPLIYGLSRSSTPGQQAAVELADCIGATIDTTASTCHAPSIMALQNVGESTASLGEVKQRSDLIVYWGSNPVVSHPRHLERFVNCSGTFVPRGRADRHVVVVDVEETETSRLADTFIKVERGQDYEFIWALRALVRGVSIPEESYGGIPFSQLHEFADRMKRCQYGAMFFGLGLTKRGIPHHNVEALLQLVTDLHLHTRFIARRMRIPGDVAGADSVLCWQTGYPFSVSLGRPYPRYNPGEFTANNMLERAEPDAVVLVGTEGVPKLSATAQAYLKKIPSIVLEYPGVKCSLAGTVHFTTAIYGLHEAGTAYRMDEVPIALRRVLSSKLPADHDVLSALSEKLSR